MSNKLIDENGLSTYSGLVKGAIADSEEVYIGTTPPVSGNYDIWINPDEPSGSYLEPGDNVSELVNDAGYLTEHQSLDGYATENWVEGKGYLTEHQSLSAYRTAAAQDIIDQGKQDTLTAGTNITIDENNVISASGGGGSSYTFTNGLTNNNGTVSWDLNDRIKAGSNTGAISIGGSNTNTGENCLAVGASNTVSNSCSTAFGKNNQSYGFYSVAEGNYTVAGNICSHAEGQGTYSYNLTSLGVAAHAEGIADSTVGNLSAVGKASHAEGAGTYAQSDYQHVEGKCNAKDNNSIFQHINGNGTDNTHRSNSYAIDWSGNEYVAGDIYVGCTDYRTNSSGLVVANCGGTKVLAGAGTSTTLGGAKFRLDGTTLYIRTDGSDA